MSHSLSMGASKTPRNVQQLLDQLLTVPANRTCADCGVDRPNWASFSLGVFVCIDCAGIHRAMGTHISKVRSVTMDKWDQRTAQFMATVGNAISNAYFEARLPPAQKLSPGATMSQRGVWIRQKYERRAWFAQPTQENLSAIKQNVSASIAASQAQAQPESNPALDDARARYLAKKAGKAVAPKHSGSAPVTPASSAGTASLFAGLSLGDGAAATRPAATPPAIAETDDSTSGGLFAGMGVSQQPHMPVAATSSPASFEKRREKETGFVRRDPRMVSASPWVQSADVQVEPTNQTSTSSSMAAATGQVDILGSVLDEVESQPAVQEQPRHSPQAAAGGLFSNLTVVTQSEAQPQATQDHDIFSGFDTNSQQQPSQQSRLQPQSTGSDLFGGLSVTPLASASVHTSVQPPAASGFDFVAPQPSPVATEVLSYSDVGSGPSSVAGTPAATPLSPYGPSFASSSAFGFVDQSNGAPATSAGSGFAFMSPTASAAPKAPPQQSATSSFGFIGGSSAAAPSTTNDTSDPFEHLVSQQHDGLQTANGASTIRPGVGGGTTCSVSGCSRAPVSRGMCGPCVKAAQGSTAARDATAPGPVPIAAKAKPQTVDAFSFVAAQISPEAAAAQSTPVQPMTQQTGGSAFGFI